MGYSDNCFTAIRLSKYDYIMGIGYKVGCKHFFSYREGLQYSLYVQCGNMQEL